MVDVRGTVRAWCALLVLSGQELRHAPHVGAVDVDREHFHAVPLHVLDQHAWVIEAHRLVVQQPAPELDRVIELQPRCLVGRARERGRV